jgi:rod shape-determining protein MreD
MRLVWLLSGVALAFVVQMKVSFFGISPNLTAVVAYYFGIKGSAVRGIFFGSLIGTIEDSVGGIILGPNLLGKGLVGFFSSFMSGSLFRWTPLLGMLSLFVLTVADGVVVALSRAIFESAPSSLTRWVLVVVAQGIFNLFIGIFIRPQNAD